MDVASVVVLWIIGSVVLAGTWGLQYLASLMKDMAHESRRITHDCYRELLSKVCDIGLNEREHFYVTMERIGYRQSRPAVRRRFGVATKPLFIRRPG